MRTNKDETWDKEGSVIAQNDHSRSFNVLNEKSNLIIRNHRRLIPTNDKFIAKQNYENIQPSEIKSRKTAVAPRTDIPF